ncbi:MYND-type domain-containing protein [Nephila pilipes]|uniref:MYND-type domain-containing protein n=1 Tax=Nephila pilipes TaxID=299642 RepID=A0A8X6PBT7_NEPPI|nr:MYND-type domain-containing protein [Nephila pilipes]
MNVNKKVRIAHIGNLTEIQDETKGQCDEEVYDVIKNTLDNVNKSEKTILSYRQLQEFTSQKKQRNINNVRKRNICSASSSLIDQNAKLCTYKRAKKNLPEKTFPLMKKCQKNWKFLKKNRCIPKPHAHVGIISRPSPKPELNSKNFTSEPNVSKKNCGSSHLSDLKRSEVFKENNCITDTNCKNSKLYLSSINSINNEGSSFLKNAVKEHQILSNSDPDYDSDYEKFVQKHKPVKRKIDFSSKSKKISTVQNVKKRKSKHKSCKNKLQKNISKITSKLLSDYTDDSSEAEMQISYRRKKIVKKNIKKNIKHTQDFSTKSKKNIQPKNNDESCNGLKYTYDTPVHYDSSEFEDNMIADLSNEGNVIDKGKRSLYGSNSDLTNVHLSETNNILPNSLSGLRNLNTQLSEVEKLMLKCRLVKCYVLVKRDLVLDQKAVLLCNNNSVLKRVVPSTCETEEDDCIILEENINVKYIFQKSGVEGFPNESRFNSNVSVSQELSDDKVEPIVSKTLLSEQNQYMYHQKSSSNLTQIQQSEGIGFVSKTQVADFGNTLLNDKENPLSEILVKDLNEMQSSDSKNINSVETEDCVIICENICTSHKEDFSRFRDTTNSLELFNTSNMHFNSPDKTEAISFASNLKTNQVTLNEKGSDDSSNFNVQILSVESLDKSKASEIADLSNDGEVKSIKAKVPDKKIPLCNTQSDDSDNEIICLDSSSSPVKSANENIGTVSEKVTEVHMSKNKNYDQQMIQCIGDVCNEISGSFSSLSGDKSIHKTDSPVKTSRHESDELQKSEKQCNQLLERNLKTNLNKKEEISKVSNELSDIKNDNAKILELLSHIDFDCIKKVLNTAPNIEVDQTEKENNILVKTGTQGRSNTELNKKTDSFSMRDQKELSIHSGFENQQAIDGNVIANCVNIAGDINVGIDGLKVNPENSREKNFTLLKENETTFLARSKSKNMEDDSSVSKLSRNIENENSKSMGSSSLQSNFYPDDECEIILHKSTIRTSSNISTNSSHNHIQLKESNPLINKSHKILETSKSLETINISSPNDVSVPQASSSNNSIESKIFSSEIVVKKRFKFKQENLAQSKNMELLNKNAEIDKICILDELDLIAIKSITNLDEHKRTTIMPLLDLYKSEFKKYKEIKCTEKNVSTGLKMLEEKQAKKLMHISSSIKNLVKHDSCFDKVFNKCENFQTDLKFCLKDEEKDLKEIPSSINKTKLSNWENKSCGSDNKIKIFHPSVVESAAEVVRSQSSGPSSEQEVYNHLINSMCAECGKQALAACLGCAKVYYCSENCGIAHWNKGHYASCRR